MTEQDDDELYAQACLLSQRAEEYRERAIAAEKNMRNRTKTAKKAQREAGKKIGSLEDEVIMLRAALESTEQRLKETELQLADMRIDLDVSHEKLERRKRECNELKLFLGVLTQKQPQ